MKNLFAALLCLAVIPAMTGCRHKLADQPLTPRQREWAEKMDTWNWKWRLPYQAPVREQGGSATIDGAAVRPSAMPELLPALAMPAPADVAVPLLPADAGDVVLVPVDGDQLATAGSQTYEVGKGDTLSKVAVKFYGKASQWRRIYDANRDKIDSPDKLKPGMKLNIPPAQ